MVDGTLPGGLKMSWGENLSLTFFVNLLIQWMGDSVCQNN